MKRASFGTHHTFSKHNMTINGVVSGKAQTTLRLPDVFQIGSPAPKHKHVSKCITSKSRYQTSARRQAYQEDTNACTKHISQMRMSGIFATDIGIDNALHPPWTLKSPWSVNVGSSSQPNSPLKLFYRFGLRKDGKAPL